jgi:tetratricopeptide (TPR) repeat protein
MIRFNLHRIFITGVLFFLLPDVHAQLDKQGLTVLGTIVSASGPVEKAVATVLEEGREIQQIGIDNSGKFTLTFSFNHEYILILSGDERFSKKIEISTMVPQQVLRRNPEFPPFVIEQSLFREIRGIDKSFSENSILRIYYDPEVDNFLSEVFYSDLQIQEQIDNAIWRSGQIKKTAEELIKFTDAELRMMRKEYTTWIQEAGENYQQGNYQEALMGYEAASRLFPEEPFPQDRIAEIHDLLLALQIDTDLSRVRDEKGRELIYLADEAMDAGSYEQAQILYRQAININDNHAYAKNKLHEVNSRIASEEQQITDAEPRKLDVTATRYKEDPEKPVVDFYPSPDDEMLNIYSGYIAQADRAYAEEEYNIARFYYYKATEIMPEESYPQVRISEIEKLIRARLSDRRDHEYQRYIDRADSALRQGQLGLARGYYNRALTVRSQKKYPKRQIDLIAEKLREMQDSENRREYQFFIDQADQALESLNYRVARYYYLRAQDKNPSEKYPKEQIRKISDILSGEPESKKPEQ